MDEPIRLLDSGIEVSECLSQIDAHPELWNLIPFRREKYGTPHNNVDDIWVRYNAWENFDGDHAKFNSEHVSSWYPAADDLPAVKALAENIAHRFGAIQLGAVLITHIPPHGMVAPHIDGGWHAGYYRKIAVQLRSNKNQAFCFENARLVTLPGDLYEFRNDVLHWVIGSDVERITLIICIRTEP